MLGDFHLHSNHSDGRHDPAALIDIVADAGLHVVALTDHDTTSGHEQAKRRAHERGLLFVPGIEMTTFGYGRVIHVLGLGMDSNDAKLEAAHRIAVDVWDVNQRRWVDSLADAGIDIRFERDFADHPVRLPVLIERLCKRGVEDGDPARTHGLFREFFDALPDDAYARLPPPGVAASIVRGAGGVALVAHPYRLHEVGLLEKLLADFDGLEAMYLPYTDEQREALQTLAQRTGKLYSAGSDYHGYFTTEYRRPTGEPSEALVRRLGL